MKIYKISQATNQGEVEVREAVATLTQAIANINKSLQIIEQNDISKLFQRQNLIKEIQAGNLARLDINKINDSLTAMANIARVVPIINTSLKTIQDNDAIAKQLKVDIRNIQNVIVTTIQQGSFVQQVNSLPGFQQMMPSIGGTESLTTL